MTVIPVYLLILLVFINRYFLGLFLKRARGNKFDDTCNYEPTITVVTPMFNEGKGIAKTINTVMASQYPQEKMEMVVVDDCSTDDSYLTAVTEAKRFPKVRVLRNSRNMGKRLSISEAVRQSSSEIIISIDSDVEIAPDALRKLVARFTHPKIAAVGGRVTVSNAHQNWLTRMQAIKYYFGYEYLKNLERALQSVLCLSGCLTAYRRSVLLELEPILKNRNILGISIKYGEDRFLTRQIVKHGYRTVSTLDAVCYTLAPSKLSKYFSQQLRWRRSNLVDFLCALSHVWKLHPLISIHYLALASVLVAYPMVVLDELVNGTFFELAIFHLTILACTGGVYWLDTRSLPAKNRVHPFWFLSMAVVMPVTYILFTPLALFTLDSSNWETRGNTTLTPSTVTDEAESKIDSLAEPSAS